MHKVIPLNPTERLSHSLFILLLKTMHTDLCTLKVKECEAQY